MTRTITTQYTKDDGRSIIIPGTSGEWYNTKRLEKYAPHAVTNMIVGARGHGKTIFGLKEMKDTYDRGEQTVWSRLYGTHMDGGFYTAFLDSGKRLGFIPDDWTTDALGVYTDETKNVDDMPCLFMPMNTAFRYQGNEYRRVTRFILDEFTVRPGEQYPNSFPRKLQSIIGTLARGKPNFKAYLFSNWTSMSNPIWATQGIYPGKHDVTYFPEVGSAIEVCRNNYYNQDMPPEDTPLGRFLASLGDAKMESETEYVSFELIVPNRPKGSKPTNMVLVTESGLYRLWRSPQYDYYDHTKKEPKDYLFVADVVDVGGGTQKIPTQTLQRLRKEIERNMVRFVDQTCLYAVMSFVYSRYL